MVSNTKLYYKRGSAENRDAAELDEIVTAAVVARDDPSTVLSSFDFADTHVQTDTQVNIVMELAGGGDLFDQVASDYQHDLLTGGRKEQSPGSDFDAKREAFQKEREWIVIIFTV